MRATKRKAAEKPAPTPPARSSKRATLDEARTGLAVVLAIESGPWTGEQLRDRIQEQIAGKLTVRDVATLADEEDSGLVMRAGLWCKRGAAPTDPRLSEACDRGQHSACEAGTACRCGCHACSSCGGHQAGECTCEKDEEKDYPNQGGPGEPEPPAVVLESDLPVDPDGFGGEDPPHGDGGERAGGEGAELPACLPPPPPLPAFDLRSAIQAAERKPRRLEDELTPEQREEKRQARAVAEKELDEILADADRKRAQIRMLTNEARRGYVVRRTMCVTIYDPTRELHVTYDVGPDGNGEPIERCARRLKDKERQLTINLEQENTK